MRLWSTGQLIPTIPHLLGHYDGRVPWVLHRQVSDEIKMFYKLTIFLQKGLPGLEIGIQVPVGWVCPGTVNSQWVQLNNNDYNNYKYIKNNVGWFSHWDSVIWMIKDKNKNNVGEVQPWMINNQWLAFE